MNDYFIRKDILRVHTIVRKTTISVKTALIKKSGFDSRIFCLFILKLFQARVAFITHFLHEY
jgi:hypothetical protein